MKQKQSSTTAEGMALVRAIEASRPEEIRICYDPIAKLLVNPFAVLLSKLTIDSGIYEKYFASGIIEFIISRERYIDDFLKAGLNDSLEQVVILGAGFDTRAYRIPGMEKVHVFEVDHPATQAVKLKRLNKAKISIPDNVTYVPVDFNTQTLSECLYAGGYNEQSKTLFIWQGVTMYLTAESINSTLTFIANHSGTGSTVIFDYFYNETLRSMKMKTAQKVTKTMGESLMFGVDAGQIETFLNQRGFSDVINADALDLKRLYFTGKNARLTIAEGAAIVSARVNKNKKI